MVSTDLEREKAINGIRHDLRFAIESLRGIPGVSAERLIDKAANAFMEAQETSSESNPDEWDADIKYEPAYLAQFTALFSQVAEDNDFNPTQEQLELLCSVFSDAEAMFHLGKEVDREVPMLIHDDMKTVVTRFWERAKRREMDQRRVFEVIFIHMANHYNRAAADFLEEILEDLTKQNTTDSLTE